jgi:hypothetical protein
VEQVERDSRSLVKTLRKVKPGLKIAVRAFEKGIEDTVEY